MSRQLVTKQIRCATNRKKYFDSDPPLPCKLNGCLLINLNYKRNPLRHIICLFIIYFNHLYGELITILNYI